MSARSADRGAAPLSAAMYHRCALESFLCELLFDVIPSPIAVIDQDYNVVDANRPFEELFGEWRGRHCFEVYKGLKRRCPRCRAQRCFVDGKVRAYAEEGVDRHGRTASYMVHVAPVTREDGSIPYLVEMSTDLTRQHQLRDELGRAHVLNRALVEASGEAILALDARGRVSLSNPAAEALFGWSHAELQGHPPPAGLLPHEFTEVLKHGEESCRVAEMLAPCKEGEPAPVSFTGVPLRHGNTQLGTAAFFLDLRELKQLERDKLNAERLAAVGQTVSGLAHGVKNILTGLEGGLYLMRTGLDQVQGERVREGFEMLERNIGRVTTFVRTLLDFSRGRTPVVRLVNPVQLAGDAADLFRDAAARTGVTVRVVAPAVIEPAAFDPEGIQTCLENLVTNGIDACRTSEREEREVVLHVREEPETGRVRIPAGSPRTVLVFEVSDNGAGMDYDIKQKVFTNFFTTKGEGGTGLGLLLTRKIVQEHGGEVTVESTPGIGTTFRLAFPRRRLPRLPQAESSIQPGPANGAQTGSGQ